MLCVWDANAVVLGDHMILNGEDGLSVHPQPRNLKPEDIVMTLKFAQIGIRFCCFYGSLQMQFFSIYLMVIFGRKCRYYLVFT